MLYLMNLRRRLFGLFLLASVFMLQKVDGFVMSSFLHDMPCIKTPVQLWTKHQNYHQSISRDFRNNKRVLFSRIPTQQQQQQQQPLKRNQVQVKKMEEKTDAESHQKLQAIKKMFSYIWPKQDVKTRFYLILSLTYLFFGKLLNAQVPFILQKAVDGGGGDFTLLSASSSSLGSRLMGSTTVAMFLLYGFSRVTSVALNELKTSSFAKVSQKALKQFSGEIFSHLHVLDSTFHHQV